MTDSDILSFYVQIFHNAVLKELDKQKDKKRSMEESVNNSDKTDNVSSSKQRKISSVVKKSGCPSQEFVDKLILQYIVAEMRPLRTIETESFKTLVKGLCPSAAVICRQTLKERLNAAFVSMKSNLQSELDKAVYVCTTADLWSSTNRSFLGMTIHWIDLENLTRRSAALACVRFMGRHSFDKIAAAISQTHASFNVESKVLKTCTDNGSNMVKAFDEYSKPVTTDTGNEDVSVSSDESDVGDDDIQNDAVLDIFDLVVDDGLNTYHELSDENDNIILPEHMRCCSHTLNLIATTDADKALADGAYKKIYRQSMAKATALWNLTSRSTKAADAVCAILGYRFLVPCVTRWNSHYDAVKKILCAETKLVEVCKAVNLPTFLQTEITFLKEYVSVMAPLAASLDILQGITLPVVYTDFFVSV